MRASVWADIHRGRSYCAESLPFRLAAGQAKMTSPATLGRAAELYVLRRLRDIGFSPRHRGGGLSEPDVDLGWGQVEVKGCCADKKKGMFRFNNSNKASFLAVVVWGFPTKTFILTPAEADRLGPYVLFRPADPWWSERADAWNRIGPL